MNILFISRNSPFESIGGVERYLTNLIAYYKTQTHTQVYIMLPSHDDSYVETTGNVTIYYDKNIFLSRNSVGMQKEISKKSPQFLEKLATIIKKHEINIICAENFPADLPPAYSLLLNMIASSHHIPVVLQLHSFATTQLQIELVNQLPWSQISCVSKSVAGDCFQKGSDINYLSTHYLGVNIEEFNIKKESGYNLKEHLQLAEQSKIILTATRIIRGKRNILQEKGVINLIESFSKLSPRYPDLKLLIAIAKPPQDLKDEFTIAYEMLLGYIKLHNVEANTIVKTFELSEMPRVYKGCDVFVLPSENETFGQVFIEAMACGIPVIGTKVGGIPEIISDSYNGYLVPPGDSSILAQKIAKLINDPLTKDKFMKAGIKTVEENFTSEKQLAHFQKMLQSTITVSEL